MSHNAEAPAPDPAGDGVRRVGEREALVRRLLPLLLIAACLLAVHSRWLTNRHTPGSDGWRIYPYVEFADNSNEIYPLWYPQIRGGVPVLAEAERYVWVSWLLDASSAHFNLGLNLLILFATFLFAVSTYVLGRRLGLRRGGATMAAVLLLGTQYLTLVVDAGRLIVLLTHAATQFAWAASIPAWQSRSRGHWLVAALLTAAVFCLLVHYALFMHLLPLALLHWTLRRPGTTAVGAGLGIFRRVTTLSVAGALVGAAVLLPLSHYNARSYMSTTPRETLGDALPQPGSLANVGLPLDLDSTAGHHKEIFLFVSLLVAPMLAFLAARRRSLPWRQARFPLALAAVSGVILLGRLPPFGVVTAVLAGMPGLWHLRQPAVFLHLAALGLALLCGFAFDRLDKRPAARSYALWLAVVLAVPAVVLAFERPWATADAWSPLPAGGGLLAAIVLVLLPFPLLPRAGWRAAGAITLLAGQLALFRPDTPIPPVPNKAGVTSPRKAAPTPTINEYLRRDPTHFRMLGPRLTGVPEVASLEGYSLYFAPENRLQLELLTGESVESVRPYWYRPPSYDQWNPKALTPLNLKYWVRRGFRTQDWTRVAEDPPWGLWRRNDWTSALRLVTNWEVGSASGEVLRDRLRERRFLELEAVLLDRPPGIEPSPQGDQADAELDLARPSSDSLEIRVDTPAAGVLFIPELYDPGWKAWVDETPVPVLRANGSFRAVPVSAGRHRVRMEYRPSLVAVGAGLSLAALLGFSAYAAIGRRWRRTSGMS